MTTAELVARLGCANNTLYRLMYRGILRPAGANGQRGAPGRLEWDEAEQRAAGAVVRFMRSHLMEPGHSNTAAEARDDALRAIANAARLPALVGCRWLMLLPDGECAAVSDRVAAGWVGPRTLIEIGS